MMNQMYSDPNDPRHVVGFGDPTAHHADLDSSFEELLEADNGLEVVRDILRSSRMDKNKMELHEFYRYEPIFRHSGVEELGEDQIIELTNEYFERICPFDPVTIVNPDGETVYLLPPIFNRTDVINMAGTVGTNVAQAFINACQLPDEVSGVKRSKYLQLYRQLFDIAQDKQRQDHVKHVSDEMTGTLMNQVRAEAQQQLGVENINPDQNPSNLNQKGNTSSSVNDIEQLPYGDDDEIEPL